MGFRRLVAAALLARSVVSFLMPVPGYHRTIQPPRAATRTGIQLAATTPEFETYKQVLSKFKPTLKDSNRVRDVDNTGWSGMLPGTGDATTLDPLLRLELVKYGELNAAVYAGFDNKSGKQIYTEPKDLLPNVAKHAWSKITDRYDVVDYFYASAKLYGKEAMEKQSSKPTWLGYIAITKDEAEKEELHGKKDIVVVFRGTVLGPEWFLDGLIFPQQYKCIRANFHWKDAEPLYKEENPHIFEMHTGFYFMYTTPSNAEPSPQESIRERLLQLVKDNPGKIGSITFVGHSLGGALAAVAAADIGVLRKYYAEWQEGDWKTLSLAAYTFAGPRVADNPFREMLRSPRFRYAKEPMVPLLNVANIGDVVPCIPAGFKTTEAGWLRNYVNTLINGVVALNAGSYYWMGVKFGDSLPGLWQYTDSGTVLQVDSAQNPEMRKLEGGLKGMSPHHNMEGYLSNSATELGPGFFRDFALLNRDQDLLNKDKASTFGLPDSWNDKKSPAKPHIKPIQLKNGNTIFSNELKPRSEVLPSTNTTRLGTS